jgi:N6-adenosine-specific RNA methylase IME4
MVRAKKGRARSSQSDSNRLARRGSPKRLRRDIHGLIIAPRREHSPGRQRPERESSGHAEGPYIELFSGEPAPGWTFWGNQINKFAPAPDHRLNLLDYGSAPR